jgi:hypothetical protein
MNAIRIVALLVAAVLTGTELVSLDYYTAQLSTHHMSQPSVAALLTRP